MFRYLSLSAKAVHGQRTSSGSAIHSFHSALAKHKSATVFTHRLSHKRAQAFARLVHIIDAVATPVIRSFSAKSTRLITTTTTFIYKKNRKGALV